MLRTRNAVGLSIAAKRSYNSVLASRQTPRLHVASSRRVVLRNSATFSPILSSSCVSCSNPRDSAMKLTPMALLVTTAAVMSLQPIPVCRAERFRFFSSKSTEEIDKETEKEDEEEGKAPFVENEPPLSYGTTYLPTDVHYNTEEIKKALEFMRSEKRVVVGQSEAATVLSSCSSLEHVTLTLIGYKGGELSSQINQDRAALFAPFELPQASSTLALSPQVQTFLSIPRILQGVFDGHAPLGELISEYSATTLPKLLAEKLSQYSMDAPELTKEDQVEITKNALNDTFIELDKTAPAEKSGGCTASVVLLQDDKIFVANTGDSRSFIVSYRPSTTNITIEYISREDKPSLPDEKARVEAAGGQVYIPTRGTSRVVYHDPISGAPTGLAMSRSIGDWEAGKMGVIPDPIIHVLDVKQIVENRLQDDNDDSDAESYQVDPVGTVNPVVQTENRQEDDVYLFAVSATDGLMDYLAESEIARILAHSLFDEAGAHPVTAAEHLIFAAANAWQQSKQGRYRDDIAISVSSLRRPPNAKPDSTGANASATQ